MTNIDLTSLEKALASLDEIIKRYDKEQDDLAIRDAAIQRFEYTYSLAVKIIIRFLRYSLPETEDSLTFNDAIRQANKAGILKSDLETWSIYRQKRNLSSHTYNEQVALEVAGGIKDFSSEVHYLLNRIKSKL